MRNEKRFVSSFVDLYLDRCEKKTRAMSINDKELVTQRTMKSMFKNLLWRENTWSNHFDGQFIVHRRSIDGKQKIFRLFQLNSVESRDIQKINKKNSRGKSINSIRFNHDEHFQLDQNESMAHKAFQSDSFDDNSNSTNIVTQRRQNEDWWPIEISMNWGGISWSVENVRSMRWLRINEHSNWFQLTSMMWDLFLSEDRFVSFSSIQRRKLHVSWRCLIWRKKNQRDVQKKKKK